MTRDKPLRQALVIFATATTVAIAALGWYLDWRQGVGDAARERQRKAICAILATIPGEHPAPAIENGRRTFARPGHPNECAPLPGLKQPPVTVQETNRNGRTRTVTIVVVPQQSAAAGSVPPSSPSPSPKPSHTPKPSPSATPSPSPSCLVSVSRICVKEPGRGLARRDRPAAVPLLALPSWPLSRLSMADALVWLLLRLA